jgi:hypothetical protein
MKLRPLLALAAWLLPNLALAQIVRDVGPVHVHGGMCEASGAVGLLDGRADHFLVANDQDNILRLYRADEDGGALPPAGGDFNKALRLDPTDDDQRVDFEGGAWLNGATWWIGSHSRSAKGKLRPSRWQLIRVEPSADGASVRLGGVTAGGLLQALAKQDPRLEAAIKPKAKEDADLAAEVNGLNIEGLAATKDGGGLMIGLRNPLTASGKAMVMVLANPEKLLAGKPPQLGGVMELDLDGRGVRSLEYVPAAGRYYIMAARRGRAGTSSSIPGRGSRLTRPARSSGSPRSWPPPRASRRRRWSSIPPAGGWSCSATTATGPWSRARSARS